jgi:predicted lipid carrier protein YhbT
MLPSRSALPTLPPLFSLALRPLPLLPLQPLLALLLQRILQRHPGIFERLGPYAEKRYGIDAIDLPFAFVLEPRPIRPTLVAVRTLPQPIDVRIAGPLAGLVGLVEGDFDGDALFFSRDLRVEGDIEALLALRNAVDDAQIDLFGEVLSGFGPLEGPVKRILLGLARPPRPSAGTAARNRAWS